MITAVTLGTTNLGSNGEVIIDLLFGLACAFWGYHISRRHRIARGVTPWRLPSIVWAVICLFLQPFGIIMELVAEFTTRPALPTPTGEVTPNFHPYPSQAAPAVVDTPGVAPASWPSVSGFAPPDDGSGKPALFGWYHDPKAAHELRYWDGRYWSDQVADHGTVATDPL